MACGEKLWDIGFRTLSSASLAADMALRKIWNFGKRIIVCWWPEYHGMAVDNIWDCYLLRGRCCSDQGMAVDPPERDERERRPREERAIGSARCNLLQYLFMYFSLYIIYILHICISVHLLPGTHISLAQVGPAGSRVGWSAVLQARALLCKPGDSVTSPD